MSTLLVVVDAQEGYLRDARFAHNRRVIASEVRCCAEQGMPALLLEMFEWDFPAAGVIQDEYRTDDGKYWHGGKTIREVRTVAEAHPGLFTVRRKKRRNGTPQVEEDYHQRGLAIDNFRLCGGYIDGCLYSTALGVFCAFPQASVEVVGYASYCNNPTVWNDLFGLTSPPLSLRLQTTDETLRRSIADRLVSTCFLEGMMELTYELRATGALTIVK